MYRYKSLDNEYFCNKDFAKKYISLPMTCVLKFPLLPLHPFMLYMQITDILLVQSIKRSDVPV